MYSQCNRWFPAPLAPSVKGMINNPTLHPNDAINRWISAILLFDFELVHIPAQKHTGADGLSRRPQADKDPPPEDPNELDEWVDAQAGFLFELFVPRSEFDPAPPLSLEESAASAFLVDTALAYPSVPSSLTSSRSSSPAIEEQTTTHPR